MRVDRSLTRAGVCRVEGGEQLPLAGFCWDCGHEFEPRQVTGRYCSSRCAQRARRRTAAALRAWQKAQRAALCAQCGGEFAAGRRDAQYCSRRCAQLARRPRPTERSCEGCGSPLKRSRRARFCSRACAQCARRDEQRTDHELLMAERSMVCEHCGEHYVAARRGRRYCSRRCAQRARRDRARGVVRAGRACSWCGESIEDRRADARFCSARCRLRAHRANPDQQTLDGAPAA